MSPVIAHLLISLATIVLSGVIASIVTFRLTSRRQDRDLLLGKLEATYTALHNGADCLAVHFLPYFRAFRQELSLDQINDLTIEHSKTEPKPSHLHNLDLLINLYFPSTLPQLENIYGCRTGLNNVVSKYEARYKQGDPDGTDLIPHLSQGLADLDKAQQALRARLLAIAEKLAGV